MRIYRFEAKMADLMNVSTIGGRMAPPSATSATDAALGLRPRRALSSAQLSAEWTTSNPLRNDSSLNSFYPLNFVSHNMGAVQWLGMNWDETGGQRGGVRCTYRRDRRD